MLILARRKGQRIRIGDNIEVVVTDVSRGEVRLGIVAPKQVTVVRDEMRREIEDANRAAAESTFGEPAHGEVAVLADLGEVGCFSSSPIGPNRS
jgi:carbon storage regulator